MQAMLVKLPRNIPGNALRFRASAPALPPAAARYGSKPVDFATSPYQCFAQTPSVARSPGGHLSIAGSNSTPTASQRSRSMRSGFCKTSRASITGGIDSRPLAHPIEDLGLLHEANVFQRRVVVLPDVGSDHLRRIANQKTVRQTRQASRDRSPATDDASSASDKKPNVEGPLCPDRGTSARQAGDHLPPIGLPGRDHLLRHRMFFPRRLEIERVERLIDHHGVGAIPHARIIAVEILRGPDHIARRNRCVIIVRRRSQSAETKSTMRCRIFSSGSRPSPPPCCLPNA